MNSENKKQLIGGIALLIIFASIFFISGYNYCIYKFADTNQPMGISTELYIMNSQYIGKLDNVPDNGNSDYLIMNCSRVFSKGTGDFKLYFETENQLRNDIQDGDFILVTWKDVQGMRVIRGVEKYNVAAVV